MSLLKQILRIVLAVIAGEIVLVLGTTFAQDILVDGVYWNTSPPLDLVLGGSFSIFAAILAGAVAYLITARKNSIPLIILSILVALETTWLITTGRTSNPTWFSLLSGLALIVGFWAGKLLLDAKRLTQ